MWASIKREALRLLREDDGFLNLLIPAISLLGGVLGGKKAKSTGEQRSGGASLQQLMPMIMQMIQQQQATSGQNYGMQMQKHQANLPMQDALRRMATGMLPNQYTQGLPTPTPISQQPVPPLAPTFAPPPRR